MMFESMDYRSLRAVQAIVAHWGERGRFVHAQFAVTINFGNELFLQLF